MLARWLTECKALWQGIALLTRLAKKAGLFCPYLWLIVFLIWPTLEVFNISFSELRIGAPPYEPLWQWINNEVLQLRISIANYAVVLGDALYRMAYLNSVLIAGISTLVCLLIGYPVAYGITRAKKRWQILLLILAVLPFWTSFLVRVYAWVNLLSPQGVVNHCLMSLGWIKTPLPLMNNMGAVVIGIVYSYLPFMIFPLFASLEKINTHLLEAAYDLGCRPMGAFWRIVVPLSAPGIISGASLVFIPAVGEYIIPELLGGSTSLTIGRILWHEFFTNRDWPVACALAVIMIGLLLIPIILFEKLMARTQLDHMT